MIKKCRKKDLKPDRPKADQEWCLYTKDGSKVLGRHPTKESALKQERAVMVHKHGSFDQSRDWIPVGGRLYYRYMTAVEELGPPDYVVVGGNLYRRKGTYK